VTFVGNEVFVDTGDNIVHIVSQGDIIAPSDLFFG
jgi:hypothetical protein